MAGKMKNANVSVFKKHKTRNLVKSQDARFFC